MEANPTPTLKPEAPPDANPNWPANAVSAWAHCCRCYQFQWLTRQELRMVAAGVELVHDHAVRGDWVDLGCHSGQLTAALLHLAAGFGIQTRVHSCDAFRGLPDKRSEDGGHEDYVAGSLSLAEAVFWRTLVHWRVPMPPILHACWIADIDQNRLTPKVALATFDGDFYSSIADSWRLVLTRLRFWSVVMVHDHNSPSVLPGARAATEAALSGWSYGYVDADKLRAFTGFVPPGGQPPAGQVLPETWNGYPVTTISA